jgi:hypothetical protein
MDEDFNKLPKILNGLGPIFEPMDRLCYESFVVFNLFQIFQL